MTEDKIKKIAKEIKGKISMRIQMNIILKCSLLKGIQELIENNLTKYFIKGKD